MARHFRTVDEHKEAAVSHAAKKIRRYTLHKLGRTTEEIAKMEGVSIAAVEKSISAIDQFREANTVEFMNATLVDVVVSTNEQTKKALRNSLTATVIGKGGDAVPNHEVQLKAVAEVREIARVIQAKAPGGRPINIPINLQQNNANANLPPPTSESRFMGFEERLRKIRFNVDAHNQLPPPESVASPLGEDEMSLEEEEVIDVAPGDTKS